MHKRQAPVPGVRESICNIASTQIEHTVENETNNNNSLLLALTAVSAAAVVASSSSSSKKRKSISPLRQGSKSPDNRPSKSNRMENNISKSWQMGLKRINELGFKLSETQKITPSDGNCFFHCISDQCPQFTDHKEVRH